MSSPQTFEQLLRDRNTAANNVNPFNRMMQITGSRVWDHLPDKKTFRNLIHSNKAMAKAAHIPQWQHDRVKKRQVDQLIEDLSHAMAELAQPDDEFADADELITLMARLQADVNRVALQLAEEVKTHRNIVLTSLTRREDAMRIIALDPLTNFISQRELIDFLLIQLHGRRRHDILRDWVTLNELRDLYPDNSLYDILGPGLCNLLQYTPTLSEIMKAVIDESVNKWVFRSLARRTFSGLVVNTNFNERLMGFTTTANSALTDEKLVYLVAMFVPHPSELRAALVVHMKLSSNGRFVIDDEMPVFRFIFQELIDDVDSLRRFTGYVNFIFMLEYFPWDIVDAEERMRIVMNHPLWTTEAYTQTIRKCLTRFDVTAWLTFILRFRIDRLDIFKFIVEECYGRFMIDDYFDPLYSDLFEEEDNFVPIFTTDVIHTAQLRNPQMSTRTQMIELMIQPLAVGQHGHFDKLFERSMALYLQQEDADRRPDMDLVALMIETKREVNLNHYLTLFPSIMNRLTNRQYQRLPPSLHSKFKQPQNQVDETLDEVALGNASKISQIAAISILRQMPLESLDQYKGLFTICNDPTIQMNKSLQAKLEHLLTEMGVPLFISSSSSLSPPLTVINEQKQRPMTRKRTRETREQVIEEGFSSTVCQRLRMWQHLEQNTCHIWNGEKTHPLVTWRFPNGKCISLTAMYEYLSNGHFQDPFDSERILSQTEIVEIFTMYYTRLRFFRLLRDAAKNLK